MLSQKKKAYMIRMRYFSLAIFHASVSVGERRLGRVKKLRTLPHVERTYVQTYDNSNNLYGLVSETDVL